MMRFSARSSRRHDAWSHRGMCRSYFCLADLHPRLGWGWAFLLSEIVIASDPEPAAPRQDAEADMQTASAEIAALARTGALADTGERLPADVNASSVSQGTIASEVGALRIACPAGPDR